MLLEGGKEDRRRDGGRGGGGGGGREEGEGSELGNEKDKEGERDLDPCRQKNKQTDNN